MVSNTLLGLSCLLFLSAVYADLGNDIYIRGAREGAYVVPGVDGVLQHSPSRGEHTYVDGNGNAYLHRNNNAVGAYNQRGRYPSPQAYPQSRAQDPYTAPSIRERQYPTEQGYSFLHEQNTATGQSTHYMIGSAYPQSNGRY